MTNFYSSLLDLIKSWLNSANSVIQWFQTPMWNGGFTPLGLLTSSGLIILAGILIVKLLL